MLGSTTYRDRALPLGGVYYLHLVPDRQYYVEKIRNSLNKKKKQQQQSYNRHIILRDYFGCN